MADADKRDRCPPGSQIAAPAEHSDFPLGRSGSQTDRAPFIVETGNGQVLVRAVCVTATVLPYRRLPCTLAKCGARWESVRAVSGPARLNRLAINKKCQILGGIDHSDRLEINLGPVRRWLTQWPFLAGPSAHQRLCLCARVSVQSVFPDPRVAPVW